jgi:hypothetical protein
MKAAHTSKVLRTGIATVLETWAGRFGGEEDRLYWALRLKLAAADGADDFTKVQRQVPAPLATEVLAAQRGIDGYFDNVRYALLDPLTQVWGTLANALRVAATVESVTERQRSTFAFAAESLAAFFRAAHAEAAVAESLWQAFKPMPAADCQTLAALFNVNLDVRLDGAMVISIARVLGNEGPLTSEESEAFATLKNTGLVNAAFRGLRGRG